MSKQQSVLRYQEAALILIDYQKEMFEQVKSEVPPAVIELNVRMLIKVAKAFGMPIVLSTVGVQMGVNGPTRESILAELPDVTVIDRSSMNAWEDEAFRAAINRSGRKRLVFGALWTEICLAFPVIDALREGYEVTFVVDAVGGMSQLAHTTAVQRLVAAGAVPQTSVAVVAELFRDWKSAAAGPAREILKPYLSDLQRVTSELAKAA